MAPRFRPARSSPARWCLPVPCAVDRLRRRGVHRRVRELLSSTSSAQTAIVEEHPHRHEEHDACDDTGGEEQESHWLVSILCAFAWPRKPEWVARQDRRLPGSPRKGPPDSAPLPAYSLPRGPKQEARWPERRPARRARAPGGSVKDVGLPFRRTWPAGRPGPSAGRRNGARRRTII